MLLRLLFCVTAGSAAGRNALKFNGNTMTPNTYNYEKNWKSQIVRFLTAQTVSIFGSSLVQYAIIWYITIETSSGVMMTLATVCGYVPQIAISLFAGVWLDRYDRKVMMIISDAAIAASTLVIAILFLTGHPHIWLLFTVLLVRSAGTGIQTPAVNAFIPQIVPKDKLMMVNGINSTLFSLSVFLSPALSAVILAYLSIVGTFFVDVITAIIGISIMLTVRSPGAPHGTGEAKGKSAISDIKAGFSYLKENKFVRQLIIYISIVGVLVGPSAFLTPLLVSRTFGPQLWRLSVVEMGFSAGAILGGILISFWGGFRNKRHTLIVATIVYGGMAIALGLSPVFWVYMIFNFLVGIALPFYNTPVNVMIQERTAPAMQGRVFSILQIASSCVLPLGTVVFGPLADIVSIQSILISSGMSLFIFGLLAWRHKNFSGA